MPRERVHHGQVWVHYPSVDASQPIHVEKYDHTNKPFREYPPGSTLHDDVSLDVTWSKDEFVQVSIDMPVERIREFATEIVTHRPEVEDVISRAIYTDNLTRSELNNMIRTLRRARDAAYGVDE